MTLSLFGQDQEHGHSAVLSPCRIGLNPSTADDLLKAEDPIGPDTDVWLSTLAVRSSFVVAAWGSHKSVTARAQQVLELVGEVHALRLTKDGHPAHPLYLPKDLRPSRWSGYVR